jgi:hypothetical protein
MKKVTKFFNPKVHTGWKKTQSQSYRRRLALKAHGNDYLSTARGLQALSNISQDKATSRLAKSDAKYFYDMNKKHQ